jgi:hypothetical protein
MALLGVVSIAIVQRGDDTQRVISDDGTAAPPRASEIPEHARDALAAWSTFPVDGATRPIVLLDSRVLPPAGGFPDDEAKNAFLSMNFMVPGEVPANPGRFEGRAVSSFAESLEAARRAEGEAFDAPLTRISRVQLELASFSTDRGVVPLPAWSFSIEGQEPRAFVLALAPSELFAGPANAFSPFGPASVGVDGTVELGFVASPCAGDHEVEAFESPSAVAVDVRFTAGGSSLPCAAVGGTGRVTITLRRPLGHRVLVAAPTGGAIGVLATE